LSLAAHLVMVPSSQRIGCPPSHSNAHNPYSRFSWLHGLTVPDPFLSTPSKLSPESGGLGPVEFSSSYTPSPGFFLFSFTAPTANIIPRFSSKNSLSIPHRCLLYASSFHTHRSVLLDSTPTAVNITSFGTNCQNCSSS